MHAPPPNETVVLISANVEWRAIRQLFTKVPVQQSPFGEWFVVEVKQAASRVLFFHGGWGKIAGAAATQYVIDRCRPDLLVNLGTCGGFTGDIERGTIVLVERAIACDINAQIGDYDEHIEHYTTELDLTWLVGAVPHEVHRTLIVSGDRDVVFEEIPKLKHRYGAVASDWESASIAWVAQRNQVRCLILRGVSDLVGPDGGEAYEGNAHVFEENTQAIMSRLVEQLPDWLAAAAR